MYKARTNIQTEEFGLIKEGEIISEADYEELNSRETIFFKLLDNEEDYNPVIKADELINEDLKLD